MAERELPLAHKGLVVTQAFAPAPVQGDAKLLSRALGNLLDNALRHAPAGSQLRLSSGCEAGPEGAWAFARIADQGPGPPDGWGDRLFEAFARPDPARTRSEGGAGVGLAIVRAAAEAHGGQALLEASAEGPGAVATLRLPSLA